VVSLGDRSLESGWDGGVSRSERLDPAPPLRIFGSRWLDLIIDGVVPVESLPARRFPVPVECGPVGRSYVRMRESSSTTIVDHLLPLTDAGTRRRLERLNCEPEQICGDQHPRRGFDQRLAKRLRLHRADRRAGVARLADRPPNGREIRQRLLLVAGTDGP